MMQEKKGLSFKDYIDSQEDLEDVEEKTGSKFQFEVELNEDGERLDKILSARYPNMSRSRLKSVIEDGKVLADGKLVTKPKQKMCLGEKIEFEIVPRPQDMNFVPVKMDLDVVHEDDFILVINKPAGLVVHPAAGHWDDTLLNGLLAYRPELAEVPRAGIVHRLDKDTSGLMVVAKTEEAQLNLVRQLQERTVKREYWALVRGKAPVEKIIDAAIERDPKNPLRFTTSKAARAKPALSKVRLVQFAEVGLKTFSWVAVRLQTGRTHQIRVHMESIGLPLIGDPLYRNKLPVPKEDGTLVSGFKRQALHASRLGLIHPGTGELMEWFAEPPADFRDLMDELGFAPWDRPTEVFGDPVVILDGGEDEFAQAGDEIGTVSSWDDFDFGDDEDDTDYSVWKVEKRKD